MKALKQIGYVACLALLALLACKQTPAPTKPIQTQTICTEDQEGFVNLFEELLGDYVTGKSYRYLVIHCTASSPSSRYTRESLLSFFKDESGWSRPGYRDFVDKDGILHNLWGYDGDSILTGPEITFGARGYNSVSIHVAYDGGVDGNLLPRDTRTEKQKVALQTYVRIVRTLYPDIKVVGHRDLPGVTKACPSFDAWGEYGKYDADIVFPIKPLEIDTTYVF